MKKKRILVIILLFVLVAGLVVSLGKCTVERITYGKSGLWQYAVPDFKKDYQKSFEIVSDELYEIYRVEKEKNNIEELSVRSMSLDEWQIYCKVGGGKDYEITVEPLKDVEQATEDVLDYFSHVNPDASNEGPYISVCENRVDFSAGNAPYIVIRTMDSSRPSYLYSPDEDYEVYIKKITKSWYHGTKVE